MAASYTSQLGGVTAEALEEARRRVRARGGQAPYGSTLDGLTEQEVESAVSRANVTGGDAADALEEVQQSKRLREPMSDLSAAQGAPGAFQLRAPMTGAPTPAEPRLRAPMVGPEPDPADLPPGNTIAKAGGSVVAPAGPWTPDPATAQDQADREAAERARRARRNIGIAGAIAAIFGPNSEQAQRIQAITAARDAVGNPDDILARIDARRGAREEARIAAEDRALNEEYRRTLMRSMDTNANRREFEMGRRTEADSRLYDPTHPVATQRREFLRRIMATAPGLARGFEGQDLDAMGSAELSRLADQVLRRIGQVPARFRQADLDELMRIAGELDGRPQAEAPMDAPAPAARGRRGAAPAPEEPQGPAPRRDRTLDEINADIIAERYGSPTSTGRPARDFTAGERLLMAQALRSSRTRQAAQLAGGVSTAQQEAQFAQVGQTGAFTRRDIERAARVLAPAASQRSAIARLRRVVRGMSDAQFAAAMSDSAALQRMFNVEEFTSAFRAMTNSELREQSGAAVTDGEARRFFAALSAGSFNSPRAFEAALARVDREVRDNVRRLVPNQQVIDAWASEVRGR